MAELKFTSQDMSAFGDALRTMDQGANSMEMVANRVVRYLFENLVDRDTGERACVLVRFFKTHPYIDLDHELQQVVVRTLGRQPSSDRTRCLTLVATIGEQPEWCSRQSSLSHRAIPLESPEMILRSPMISQLISQLGLDLASVVEPDPNLVVDLERKTYNVFYVPQAIGSAYVSDQEEFVKRFGVQSVLGFGGMLALGDLFAVILFSRLQISKDTAHMFTPLALSTKIALLPFVNKAVFERS